MNILTLSKANKKLAKIEVHLEKKTGHYNKHNKWITITNMKGVNDFIYRKDLVKKSYNKITLINFFDLVFENIFVKIQEVPISTKIKLNLKTNKIISFIEKNCLDEIKDDLEQADQMKKLLKFEGFKKITENNIAILDLTELKIKFCSLGGNKYYIAKEASETTALEYYYLEVKIKNYRIK